jgi:hypothetical protein
MAEAFKVIMTYEKIGAVGVASFPVGYPKSLDSTMKVTRGVLTGLKQRK